MPYTGLHSAPHGVSSNAAIVIPAAQLPDDVIVPGEMSSTMEMGLDSIDDLSNVTFTTRANGERERRHSLTETDVRVPIVGSSQLVTSQFDSNEDLVVVKVEAALVYAQLLQTHISHDAISRSSKLIILDTAMLLSKAFYVLIYNGVRIALLYDSKKEKMTDCLSTTDLIHAILTFDHLPPIPNNAPTEKGDRYVHSKMVDAYLGHTTIGEWQSMLEKKRLVKPLITASMNMSLLSAVALMSEHRLHRIFVNNDATNNAVGVLSYQRILRFMVTMAISMPMPPFMDKCPMALGIGVWDRKLKTVKMSDSLYDCLRLMIDNDISGVPIVNGDGVLVDVYTRFDCISLVFHDALSCIRSTPMTEAIRLKQTLLHKPLHRPSVSKSNISSSSSSADERDDDDAMSVKLITCTVGDSLQTIMKTIVENGVYRVILVDDKGVARGVITAADLIRFVALKPAQKHMLDICKE